VVRVFREEGASAKTLARPKLRDLIEYCSSSRHRVDMVLVYRFDRLARAVADHHALKSVFAAQGISVRAVEESFDDSPTGQFMENVVAAMAQFDNDQRSARTRAGMTEALRQGRWMWRTPLGYQRPAAQRDGPSLVIDSTRGQLVRRIFELFATGEFTQRDVLDQVVDLGLTTAAGKSLSSQTLGAILRNPIYTGRIVSPGFGVDCEGDFEPIVSRHVFDRVQRVLSGDVVQRKRMLDHPDFPLRRIVRCGECGTPLTGSWSKGRSKRYAYYRCREASCLAVKVQKEVLESDFEELIERLMLRRPVVELLSEVVVDAARDRTRDVQARNGRIKVRIGKLEARKAALFEAYVYGGRIDRDVYESELSALELRLTEEIEELEEVRPVEDIEALLAHSTSMLSDLHAYWNHLEPEQRPRFLRVLAPDGLSYRDRSFGTVEKTWLMGAFDVLDESSPGLVGPPGFEPGTSSLSGMNWGFGGS
jgi:site-specific DNA recombinase